MKIRVHREARAEIESAAEWYSTRRAGLGEDFIGEVSRAFEAIREGPLAWPVWPDTASDLQIRRFVLPRFPFSVAFQVAGESIIVLSVAHAKRRPGYWIGRVGST